MSLLKRYARELGFAAMVICGLGMLAGGAISVVYGFGMLDPPVERVHVIVGR